MRGAALRLLRFGGVSAFCLLLHNGVLIAADAAGVGYGAAVVASYLIVVVAGFGLHNVFTFRTRPTWPAFARYAVAMAGNMPAQWVLLWLLVDGARMQMIQAAPLSTAILILFNFSASRWALFGATARLVSKGG